VADEVIFKEKLLAEDEAEVCLGEESVQVACVLADQLVKYVLKNCAYLSEGEHVILTQGLRLLVLSGVEGEVLEWKLNLFWWCTELGQCHGAALEHEAQVLSPAFLIEQEVLLAPDAQPVEKLQADLDELQRFESPFWVGLSVIIPNQAHDLDQKAATSLQGLRLGEFRNCALVVEVLDPAL